MINHSYYFIKNGIYDSFHLGSTGIRTFSCHRNELTFRPPFLCKENIIRTVGIYIYDYKE